MAEVDSLSPKQRRAILVLLSTGSIGAAADAAGVSLRTMQRWQASEAFAAVLHESSRQMAGEALRDLLAAGSEAVQALRETVRTGAPSLRVRAAQILLENGLRVANGGLDQRVARLEEAWQPRGSTLRNLS